MAGNQELLSHPKYRPDIDGLRAVAVLAVVAFHAFPSWIKGGFIGVDVFFVISGYLISTIIFENLDKGTFKFKEFYARRIKRIFPALIIVLIACAAFGWFALIANEYKQLGKHILSGSVFISNYILWNESGYFDNSTETKPLLHLWSLGIEEQFYIVWPLLVWIAWKGRFNIIKLTVLVAIVSFIWNLNGVKQDMVATFYSPQTRFWELLCGSLLSLLSLYYKDKFINANHRTNEWIHSVVNFKKKEHVGNTQANSLSIIGLFLLIFGFFRINKELSFPGAWALVPVLGSILIIAAGSKAWVNQKILSNVVVVWFGLISFPLYLWHWPILSFAHIVEGEVPSINIRIAGVILSLLLAWLTYKQVEYPLRFGKRERVSVTVLIIIMGIVGYVGYNISRRDGLTFRSINNINEGVNDALSYNWNEGFRFGKCFINDLDEGTNKFSNLCGLSATRTKPMLMIWGDSHSASLYRGFEKNGNELGFIVSQFSASGCPPVLDFFLINRKECINSNEFVINEIKKLKPDVVVIGANWEMYDGNAETKWEKIDFEKFKKTIESVRSAGVKNIVVIGQLPVFNTNQADMLKRKFIWSEVETVTYRNFKSTAVAADNNIRDLSLSLGVTFISPLDILCGPSGCVISIPGDEITPLSYDYGHLTTLGSEYLVSKFFQNSLIKFNN